MTNPNEKNNRKPVENGEKWINHIPIRGINNPINNNIIIVVILIFLVKSGAKRFNIPNSGNQLRVYP